MAAATKSLKVSSSIYHCLLCVAVVLIQVY